MISEGGESPLTSGAQYNVPFVREFLINIMKRGITMINKILTSMLLVSMTAAPTLFSLPASAESKVESKVESENKNNNIVEVNVKGYMADEWLAKHDEFDITFEHDGEKIYGFFNKSNDFEREIELQEGIEYNVTFSDDFEGFVVQGFDDTFTPDKDKTARILTVLPTEEKKDETSSKMTMDDEELAEYKIQRELVQEFVDLTEKYGLCDDSNEYWKALSDKDKKSILNCGWCEYNNKYDDIKGVEYGKTDYNTLKKHFAYEFLYGRIYTYCHEQAHSNDDYIETFSFGTESYNNVDVYLGNYDSLIKPIMDYDQSYWDKYHEIPDLYAVYLDIINGVEYENIDTSETDLPESSEDSLENNLSNAEQSSLNVDENSSEITSQPMPNEAERETAKTTLIGAIKNNIITIILAIVLGCTLLYIKKIKTKTNKKNDDY